MHIKLGENCWKVKRATNTNMRKIKSVLLGVAKPNGRIRGEIINMGPVALGIPVNPPCTWSFAERLLPFWATGC